MFVTTQPWQKDEDYVSLMQDLKPPPPPGDETIWELHFCKWWGWNWVKRKDVAEVPMQRSIEAPLQTPVQNTSPPNKSGSKKKHENKLDKKPEKKPIKNLCRTLCFKNTKKQQKPLQEMYNTPSNSVIEDTKMEKNAVHNGSGSPNTEQTHNGHENSSVQREIEEMVTKENKHQVHTHKVQSQKKKKMQTTTSSSSEECSCSGDRSGSSREDHVEYINIACCPCCHHPPERKEMPMTKKQVSESYTQPTPLPRSKMISTQTEERRRKEEQKKHRRRHICVVCCSCEQSVPRCCPCNQNNGREAKIGNKVHKHHHHEHHDLEATPNNHGRKEAQYYKADTHSERGSTNRYSQAYNVTTEQSSPFIEKSPQTTFNKKNEPVYKTRMPLDMMLLCDYNKPITKFGMPSQNYSWIHATKSDIWDQLFHLRTSHQFSSPVSGNVYNIAPKKVDSGGPEPSVLLNPLSVDEELQSLRKIENEVKMDLKSRIMLDAVCDAILSKDKPLSHNSSILLNELTYPSSITQTESIINDLYKSEKKQTNSKLNQTETPNEIIFEDIVKECDKSRNVGHENTNELKPSLSAQGNKSFSEFARVRSPRTYSIENSFMRIAPNPSFSFNYNSAQNYFKAKNDNHTACKLSDLVINNNPSLPSMTGQAALSRTGLMSAYKRSASPPTGQNVKKAKLKEPPLTPLDNRNITDIFKKIDEIVLRSKVNNEEIQNVLKAIPKKTFQFFTSWEVANNVMDQNPSIQIKEPQGIVTSTSSMNTIIIEKEDQNRIKIPAVKKKKAGSRPSLIPKRVADAKLNKK